MPLFQSCYLGPGNSLPLEMSIVVAVENSSRQPEESTQALLDHLSIVYVATAESGSSGKVGALQFLLWGCSSVECALAPGPSGAGQNESLNPFLPACLGLPAPLFSLVKESRQRACAAGRSRQELVLSLQLLRPLGDHRRLF